MNLDLLSVTPREARWGVKLPLSQIPTFGLVLGNTLRELLALRSVIEALPRALAAAGEDDLIPIRILVRHAEDHWNGAEEGSPEPFGTSMLLDPAESVIGLCAYLASHGMLTIPPKPPEEKSH